MALFPKMSAVERPTVHNIVLRLGNMAYGWQEGGGRVH